jgi:hypothetical protein
MRYTDRPQQRPAMVIPVSDGNVTALAGVFCIIVFELLAVYEPFLGRELVRLYDQVGAGAVCLEDVVIAQPQVTR